MTKETKALSLTGKMDLALPDGSVVRVQPGPYGKGISVTPLSRSAPGISGKGRPPRPSTLELRQRLAADKAAGKLRAARDYVEWVAARDPKAPRAGLQQTVYRELRAAGGAKGKRRKGGATRGRTPHPATLALRERLAKDKEAGPLKEPGFYIRWLVEKSDVGLKQARPIVYRELRSGA
ncbi:MAG TPA: hypothetical protein VM241_05470 [Candidatus Thermoplasmatota archaeon]|nr:hypothetical protein [Candidatus Thermoplasmatota archaeon]